MDAGMNLAMDFMGNFDSIFIIVVQYRRSKKVSSAVSHKYVISNTMSPMISTVEQSTTFLVVFLFY